MKVRHLSYTNKVNIYKTGPELTSIRSTGPFVFIKYMGRDVFIAYD